MVNMMSEKRWIRYESELQKRINSEGDMTTKYSFIECLLNALHDKILIIENRNGITEIPIKDIIDCGIDYDMFWCKLDDPTGYYDENMIGGVYKYPQFSIEDKLSDDFIEPELKNPYPLGSVGYITVEAEKYEDIQHIQADIKKYPHQPLMIICKPDYNKEKVMEFIEDNIPLGTSYEIIVQKDFKELKEINEDLNETTEMTNEEKLKKLFEEAPEGSELANLKIAMEKAANDMVNEHVKQLMKEHSLTYGEAMIIAKQQWDEFYKKRKGHLNE